MKKYKLATWFEESVYFEVYAKNKKEAIQKVEDGLGEVHSQRGCRRGDWEEVTA